MTDTRRVARAQKYSETLAARQGVLTAETLRHQAPFVVRRVINVFCDEYGKMTQVGPFTREGLHSGQDTSQCKARHTVGERKWAVTGSLPMHKNFLIMELFNDILMAKALRDDLNFKAGMAIMERESRHEQS